MNKTKISAGQMEALLAFFYLGSSLTLGSSSFARQDTWFCIIIGMLLACPLLWLHSGIIDLYPGRNYYDNIIKACGKIPGKILVLVLSLYALFTGGLVLRTEAEFIRVANLTETPLLALLASLIGAAIYILRHRIYVLSRVAKFLLPLVYLSVFLTVSLSFKDWHISNMKPFLNTGFPTLAGGSLLVLSLPFGETAVGASLFGQLDSEAKSYPILLKGALLGFVILLVANVRNLLVLGYSAGFYSFSSYAGVSVIALGEFFTRIEVLIGIDLLLSGVFKACVLLFGACSGFAKVFGLKDYEPLAASSGLAVMTVSVFVGQNMQELLQLVKFIPYYSLPIQILIPLAALIAGKIRNRLKPAGKAKAKPAGPGKLPGQPKAERGAAETVRAE